ncbi:hypothetical protein D3C84_496200 [compost metagenome]
MMDVAQVAELPDHFRPLLGWPDRVVQRHQAAATSRVHQEGIFGGVEQQGLVASQGEATIGLIRGRQYLCSLLKLLGVGQVDHRSGSTQQPRQGHDHQQHRATQRRAQASWRIGVEGELPPQLMTVGHVLIGEQQQPDRCADHAGTGHQVDR